MYQSLFFDHSDKQYYLRDDEKGWSKSKYYPKYYVLDKKGPFHTLDGKRAKEIHRIENYDDPNVYEKDVDKLTRFLVDHYYESDEIPKYQNIGYLDIETEIAGALTPESIKAAPNKVTAIALFDSTTKQKWCWILDEEKRLQRVEEDNKFIVPCDTEKDLLLQFLDKWEEFDFTIITGWNSGFFDIPYLYHRISRVCGYTDASRLSPIRKIKFNDYDEEQPVDIGGINHLDYMLLFKKYITKQEDSYKLGEIGKKYVKLSKIEYEGSLDRLFKEDPKKFIEYNVRDIEIIIELEKKLKFIELTITICHLCHVPYEQIYLSTVLNEGAILTYLKRKKVVSPNKPTTINKKIQEINEGDEVVIHKSLGHGEGEVLRVYDAKVDVKFKSGIIRTYPARGVRKKEEYAGGYLKDPIPGLYEWVIDLDFTSLYPSIIRSLNMGLETLIGRIVNRGKYDNSWTLLDLKERDPSEEITIEKLNQGREIVSAKITVGEIVQMIEENNFIVAANGSLFRTDKNSVVCEVLTDWFNKRTEYKNLMKDAYKVKKDPVLGEFYDKRQHAYKIKLNDVYGSYAINGWRYTDGHKFISAAITLTGQRLDQEAIKFANVWLNRELGTEGKDYVVTADTDSLFINVKDLIKHRYPNTNLKDREQVVPIILEIAKEIQKASNDHLNDIVPKMFNTHGREHYFELKQEVVLERGYFSGKRRYAMFIVNKEGVPKEELDIKGMDLMKSNMPVTYREFGETILKSVLFGRPKSEIDKSIVDFKNKLKDEDWRKIAKSSGVKKISEYIKRPPTAGQIFSELGLKCPVYSKACIFYNDLIRFKKLDKKYSCFTEGDKMKYVILKPNPYKIDVLAFNGNDPEFINTFIEEYVDREEIFNSILLNKLTNLYDDISWSFPPLNNRINKFFKFV